MQVSGVTGAAEADARRPDPAPFLGWSPPASSATGLPWRPIQVDVIATTPTALQRSFGQHWLVCVVTPLIGGASCTGSVDGMLATGRVPVAFAECTAGPFGLGAAPLPWA